MEIWAVFYVEQELKPNADGEMISIHQNKLKGYAVFESGKMISEIFPSYNEAAKWIEKNQKEECADPLATRGAAHSAFVEAKLR